MVLIWMAAHLDGAHLDDELLINTQLQGVSLDDID